MPMLALAVFVPVVPPCTHTAPPTPRKSRHSLNRYIPFRHLRRLVPHRLFCYTPFHSFYHSGTCNSHPIPKQKVRQPCRNRQPAAALILRASCCRRPCSTRSRLAPVPCKNCPYSASLHCYNFCPARSRLLYLFGLSCSPPRIPRPPTSKTASK